jgi:RNA polymerase sigma-70 factor (ECF subfamily)
VGSTGSEQRKSNKNKSRVSGKLAVKIITGDQLASNEFVQINYQWLLFVVRRKFAQSNNHEDIVQDTFMLVIKKLQQGSINNPNAISAYLRSTAINIGFEYLRKDKKFFSATDQEYLEVIEDCKQDILSTLIWQDKVHYVKQVMDGLTVQRDKDILIKFYFNDENKKSICAQLVLSSEHFDRVLYRAKQRLKQLIEKKGNDKPNNSIKSFNTNKDDSNNTNILQKIIHTYARFKRRIGRAHQKLIKMINFNKKCEVKI